MKQKTFVFDNYQIIIYMSIQSNKTENCFLKNFPKIHEKKIFKSDYGILKRFDLKLKYWDDNNANY